MHTLVDLFLVFKFIFQIFKQNFTSFAPLVTESQTHETSDWTKTQWALYLEFKMATIRVEDSGGKHVAVVSKLEQNKVELSDFCNLFSTKCTTIRWTSKIIH